MPEQIPPKTPKSKKTSVRTGLNLKFKVEDSTDIIVDLFFFKVLEV